MSKNLVTLTSSRGYEQSVSNQEVVIKPNPSMKSFAWKQLSIRVKADCEIIINGNGANASTIHLVADTPFEIENFNINSLKFKQSSIPYYYIAGY